MSRRIHILRADTDSESAAEGAPQYAWCGLPIGDLSSVGADAIPMPTDLAYPYLCSNCMMRAGYAQSQRVSQAYYLDTSNEAEGAQ